jgi:mannose-binding lectin 2
LELQIDARNTGEWTKCVTLNNLRLPVGWLEHAHIGLTASTGQLADNHDVISLATYRYDMSYGLIVIKSF